MERAARIWGGGRLVSYSNQYYDEPHSYFADADLFQVLTGPFVTGNPETAIREPFTVVLTKKIARKCFGSKDSVGRMLRLDDEYELRVTGVIQEPLSTTHFQYDFVASLATLKAIVPAQRLSRWTSPNNYATYVRLRKEADPAGIRGRVWETIRRRRRDDQCQA